MQYLRGLYEKLSEDKKDEFFEAVDKFIKWRGWTKDTLAEKLAELIRDETGIMLEEYT